MSTQKQPVRCVSSKFARLILPVIAIMLAAPIASYAGTIGGPIVDLDPPSGFAQQSNIYGGEITTASYTFTGSTDSSITESGSVYQTGLGALVNYVPYESEGLSELTFYLQALPIIPVPTLSVPIVVVSDVSTTLAASEGLVSAAVFVDEVSLTGSYGPDYVESNYCSYTSGCTFPSGGISDLQLTLNAGELYVVNLTVAGEILTPGTWSATIDPDIYIDPSFQYASDFVLETSPPLTSSSGPEPSSSLLLGAGLLLVGAGLYKRHTKPVALSSKTKAKSVA